MYLNLLNDEQKKDFWVIARELSKRDGIVLKEEEYLFTLYAQEMQIDKASFDSFQRDVDVAIESLSNCDKEIKIKVYIELAALALCDKEYHNQERSFMNAIQGKFSISDEKKACIEEEINKLIVIYDTFEKIIHE